VELYQALLISSMLFFLSGYLWIQVIKNKFIGTVLLIVGFIGVLSSIICALNGG
jgi:hypothetical protein